MTSKFKVCSVRAIHVFEWLFLFGGKMIIDTNPPTIRQRLKGSIFIAGYKNFSVFAECLGVHRAYLSKVLNGHEHPSPNIQRKMAAELGLTLVELKELL